MGRISEGITTKGDSLYLDIMGAVGLWEQAIGEKSEILQWHQNRIPGISADGEGVPQQLRQSISQDKSTMPFPHCSCRWVQKPI